MKGNRFTLIGLSIAAALVAVCGVVLWIDGESQSDGKIPLEKVGDSIPGRRRTSNAPGAPERFGRSRTRIDGKRQDVAKRLDADRAKPLLEIDEDEELTKEYREVLTALRSALDSGCLKDVKKSLRMLRHRAMELAKSQGDANPGRNWRKYVSRGMKTAAIEAAGWFGTDGVDEVMEFVDDPDVEVQSTAWDQFEQAVSDPELADYEKAAFIRAVASSINSEDAADWLLMEAGNARNSVAIETFTHLAQNGTEIVKAKVPESIEDFTCGEATTVEGAQNWLKENQGDPEMDEEMYGHVSIE